MREHVDLFGGLRAMAIFLAGGDLISHRVF
jgi:hypothetical protein